LVEIEREYAVSLNLWYHRTDNDFYTLKFEFAVSFHDKNKIKYIL